MLLLFSSHAHTISFCSCVCSTHHHHRHELSFQVLLHRAALGLSSDHPGLHGGIFKGRIIGSAEALPILCVSDFCERERERETPVTSFDITLKSRVIMHMITSTAR